MKYRYYGKPQSPPSFFSMLYIYSKILVIMFYVLWVLPIIYIRNATLLSYVRRFLRCPLLPK
jgi:hypothetical protein